MEKIKKISLFLVLVLILSICFYTKTYAALSCSVSMSASSNEVTEGNEFTVSIGVNNIQSDKGVIIYGGTVEYDKNILTCTGKSGAGEWAPSFNKENGKFVADRDNGFAKTGETVLKLTFKVKEGASGSTSITVKDALASDGIEDKSAGTAKTTINIKSKDSGNKDEGENQGGNSNQGGSNSGTNKPSSNGGTKKPTPNKVVNASTEPKNEENTVEETNIVENTIDENIVDENNTVKNEVNIFDNEEEYVQEESKDSKDKTTNILIICLACVLGVLAVIAIVIFIKKKKLTE